MSNTTIATTGYKFNIYGVELPATLTAYKKIYVAISTPALGLIYSNPIDDTDIGTAAPTVI
jgi:hypothetical protein